MVITKLIKENVSLMTDYTHSVESFDNFNHLKAYDNTLVKNYPKSIIFGVDDIDGTIDDTTKSIQWQEQKIKTHN